ncbi:hypothetical protein EVAR_94264_1 [Eumeta japonica]|uniref:Cation-transporting P-type ATPase N-terminal domain-containing protein n=1 Tax=Eumeta variegata TaxID=151549 RepID=A0A4C1UFP9_EUMVA|nr:hypothetical protein EVAR_94264_1 [Eumeta japonica]
MIGAQATAARQATLENDSAVPPSTVAKIIKEISVGVPPPRPRRSKTVALRPGVATRGAAGKHLPRHSCFFFPSRRCRKSTFQNSTMEDAHTKSVEEVISYFGTDQDKGLSTEQIKRNQDKYGPNEPEPRGAAVRELPSRLVRL